MKIQGKNIFIIICSLVFFAGGLFLMKLSLLGYAIVSVKIDGVIEDVTAIVLNLKGVVIKNHSDDYSYILRLHADNEGEVTAGDIEADTDIEILNPEQVICTLAAGANEIVEEKMIEAIYKCHEVNQTIIAFINNICKEVGPLRMPMTEMEEAHQEVLKKAMEDFGIELA